MKTAESRDVLRARVLWFTVERTSVNGRRCRTYTLLSEDGEPLVRAVVFLLGRTIDITGSEGEPLMVMRRRWSFPITGKFDLLQPDGRRLGQLSRNGRFLDGRGNALGRFRDARSLKERTGESAIQALFELALSLDDSNPVGSGPTAFVLTRGERATGTLVHTRMPALQDGAAAQAPGSARRALLRLVPFRSRAARLMDAVVSQRGWKLERSAPPAGDPRTEIAAALLAIELSYW